MKPGKLLILSFSWLVLFGCKENNENAIALTAIECNAEELNLSTGDVRQVKAKPVPQNADPGEMPFKWESANPEVATVSATGEIEAVSAGSTEVTVRARVSARVNKKIAVTVIDKNISLAAITVSPKTVEIDVNETQQITAKPEPPDAMGVSFLWESDNEDVATVSATGLVTGKMPGAALVTVKSGNIEKSIPVTVRNPPFGITIGEETYRVDTLNFEEISQGIKWFEFTMPEFVNGFGTLGKGLMVNSFEIDISRNENRLEVCPASNATPDNREPPSSMYKRKQGEYVAAAREPVAVINGDFYLLPGSNNTGYAYIDNRPLGMEISNGMLMQTPFSSATGFVIRDDGTPGVHDNVSFSGRVSAGNEIFPLAEVNGFAGAGELVLFNNMADSYPTDSAFAWSPYTSTMVSLSYPEGGWRVNDTMEFTVTAIDRDVETTIPANKPYKGKDFNGQGAILVGNSSSAGNDSKTFLDRLKIGDNVSVSMDVLLNSNKVADKHLNVIGYHTGGLILQDGTPVNTSNSAHPRTAIGYSQDKKKIYLIVVDGRQSDYSVGATTGQVGAILKALGAYTAVNLDGGGSSCMVVNRKIKNRPSDGSERPVANGLMVTVKK